MSGVKLVAGATGIQIDPETMHGPPATHMARAKRSAQNWLSRPALVVGSGDEHAAALGRVSSCRDLSAISSAAEHNALPAQIGLRSTGLVGNPLSRPPGFMADREPRFASVQLSLVRDRFAAAEIREAIAAGASPRVCQRLAAVPRLTGRCCSLLDGSDGAHLNALRRTCFSSLFAERVSSRLLEGAQPCGQGYHDR
jgi:hypothetical protein